MQATYDGEKQIWKRNIIKQLLCCIEILNVSLKLTNIVQINNGVWSCLAIY